VKRKGAQDLIIHEHFNFQKTTLHMLRLLINEPLHSQTPFLFAIPDAKGQVGDHPHTVKVDAERTSTLKTVARELKKEREGTKVLQVWISVPT